MRLDPRTKIGMVLLVSVTIFLLDDWRTMLLSFGGGLVLWRAAGLSLAELYRRAKPLAFLFLFLLVVQAAAHPGRTALVIPFLGRTVFTLEGLGYGVSLSLRVLTLAATVPALLATTRTEEIVLALTKFGLPYRTAFLVTTALNQLPVLRRDLEAIILVQRLRGSDAFGRGRFLKKLWAYPTLVVPLVMTAMRRANTMGAAMEARAFGCAQRRSSIHTLRYTPADALVFCSVALCSLALVMGEGLL